MTNRHKFSGYNVPFTPPPGSDFMAYMIFTIDNDLGVSYTDIWSVPLAGGASSQLTSASAFDLYQDPDASPDYAQIVYVKQTAGAGNFELQIMNADGSGQTVLDSASCAIPQWSVDGTKIVYRQGTNVKTINPDGSGVATVVTKTSIRRPQWNRDGTLIGYQRATSPGQLWVIAPDGSGDLQLATLATGSISGIGYSWLHAADQLVFSDPGATGQVFIVNDDGTGTTDLTSGNIQPALTRYAIPSDDSVAYTAARSSSPWPLYQVPLNGSGESQVGTVTGTATFGEGQYWVYGDRVYTVRSSDGSLVSVALDGTDLRVEHTPDQSGTPLFEEIMILTQTTGL